MRGRRAEVRTERISETVFQRGNNICNAAVLPMRLLVHGFDIVPEFVAGEQKTAQFPSFSKLVLSASSSRCASPGRSASRRSTAINESATTLRPWMRQPLALYWFPDAPCPWYHIRFFKPAHQRAFKTAPAGATVRGKPYSRPPPSWRRKTPRFHRTAP